MNLLDGTLDDAVEALARRAVHLRYSPATASDRALVKQANFLGGLGETLKGNPALTAALVGGGLGAGVGGIHAAVTNRGKDPSERRGIFGSALTGGLAGGAIGGGLGLARQGYQKLTRTPQGVEHGDAIGPGEFDHPLIVDEATGKPMRMRIDPDVLKSNPGIVARMKELNTPSSASAFAGTVLGGFDKLRDQVPITGTAAAIGGAADLALHNPLTGFARRSAENVGGRIGRNLLGRGAAASSTLEQSLKDAITGNVQLGGVKPVEITDPVTGQKTYSNISDRHVSARGHDVPKGKGVLEILGGGKATKDIGTGSALEVTHLPTVDGKQKVQSTSVPGATDEIPIKVPKGEIKVDKLNHAVLGQLKAEGQAGSRFADRQLYQIPRTRFSYTGARSLPAALASRAVFYGAPMASEFLLRGIGDDAERKSESRRIVSQFAKPVGG